jgi:four helix bundle protein
VPANIVEGSAKHQRRARLNFYNIAQASLAEVGYCIHVALRLGYIPENVASDLERRIKQVGAPLAGLIRSERFHIGVKVVGVVIGVVFLTSRLS